MNLAEKYFGETFSGFWVIVREVGEKIGVDISSVSDVLHYKFDVLNGVLEHRKLTTKQACECIEYICGKKMFSEETVLV